MNDDPDASPPPRVRVTSPRSTSGRSRRVPVASEIDAQTRIGEIYMSSLLRAQLRLSGMALATIVLTVGALPLLFWLVPSLTDVFVLGMPLPWVLLGFVVYPYLLGIGWLYVRAAERNERDFTDVVERSE